MDQSASYRPAYTGFLLLFLTTLGLAVFTEKYLLLLVPIVCLVLYYGIYNLEAVFLLLLIAVPWSIELNINPRLGTDVPDEPLMMLVTASFIVRSFYDPSILERRALKHPLIVILFVQFVWTAFAVTLSTDWLVSIKFLAAKTWYLCAFVLIPVLLFSKRLLEKAAIVFIVSLIAVTIVVMIKHGSGGFLFRNINEAAAPFFRNHVNYSAMVVCGIPILIVALQLSKNRKTKGVILFCIVLLSLALFLSFARGAWLALTTGLMAYLLLQKRLLLITFLLSCVVLVAAVFWLKKEDRYLRYAHDYNTTVFHEDFREHLSATYSFRDVSTAERFNRWIAGVRMIKDSWATGFGPNTFYQNYRPYTIPAFRTWVSRNEDRSTVHNYFLLVLVEQGIPGLLLFLLLAGAFIFLAEQIYHLPGRQLYRPVVAALASIMTMILTVNFLSDLVETDKIGSLFYLCIGLLIAIDLQSAKKHSDPATNIQGVS